MEAEGAMLDRNSYDVSTGDVDVVYLDVFDYWRDEYTPTRMTPDQARELAGHLLQAAGELDR